VLTGTLKNIYDNVVIFGARGVGWLVSSLILAIKAYFVPAGDFVSIGYALVSAALFVGPLLGPIVMIISRRIIQTSNLSQDRSIILGCVLIALALSIFSLFENLLNVGEKNEIGFLLSICAFVIISTLNSQYIVWLNESDRTSLSLLFVVFFILSVPLSMLIREITDIGLSDRSFTIESIVLCLPLLIHMGAKWPVRADSKEQIYEISTENYTKYFLIALFYNAIIWSDWTIGRNLLNSGDYIAWASDRILFERIFLPIITIFQLSFLWRMLRISTGPARKSTREIGPKINFRFNATMVATTVLALLCWAMQREWHIVHYGTLLVGYLTYGVMATFLDLYQAEHRLKVVLILLAFIMAVRTAACYAVMYLSQSVGYGLFWALSSILILTYLFHRSKNQIRIGAQC
jgi:hypothetical protein